MRIDQAHENGASRGVRIACVVALCLALTACGTSYRNHGYVPPQEELDEIVIGIDTRASVEETLGGSASSSVLEDDAMYFVRSRVRQFAALAPKVVERQVVAISFDNNGVVENIESFGLEKGQVVPLSRRTTDSSVRDKSFFQQLFGNIGGIGPGTFGGSGL